MIMVEKVELTIIRPHNLVIKLEICQFSANTEFPVESKHNGDRQIFLSCFADLLFSYL